MSFTEIYKFKKDGNAEFIGETKNSHRGAAAIWDIMDERYLPAFIPDWAHRTEYGRQLIEKRERFSRQGDEKELQKVWSLFDSNKISNTDRIVLGSTFDNVIILKEDLPKLIEAFRHFNGNTSLKEQADIILEASVKDDDLIAIGWNQTSVNGDNWSNYGGDDDLDQPIPYNIHTGTRHWSLFSEIIKS